MTPLQIDISVRGVTPGQYALALGLVIIAAVVVAAAAYRQQYLGLDEQRRTVKSRLLAQRESLSGTTIRFDTPAALGDGHDRITALFDEDATADDHATVWTAVAEVRGALALAWQNLTGSIPRLAIYLVEEALIIIVLGAIALQSLPWWRTLFTIEGRENITLQWVAEQVIDIATTVITTGLELLSAFPFGETVYSLLLTLALQAGTYAYEFYVVDAAILVVSAVAIAALARRVADDVSGSVIYSRTAAGLMTLAALVVIWTAGAVPVLAGRVWGAERLGALVGFALAALVTLALLGELCWTLGGRLRRLGRGDRSWDVPTAVYVALRWLSTAAAVAFVPVVAVYLVVAVAEGRIVDVIEAFLAGDREIQAAIGGVALALVVGIVLQTRAAWPDVRAALAEVLSRRAVRVALFGRAVPLGIVGLAYFVAIAFVGSNVIAATIAALAAGVVSRVLWELLQRARYRVAMVDRRARTASRVLVTGYQFDTPDGPLYVAEVNTVRLAHTDVSALADAVQTVGADLFESGSERPTVAAAVAEDAFQYGIVDASETRRRLERKLDEDLLTDLRAADGMRQVAAVESDLEEYPEPVRESRLRDWRVSNDLRQRRGYYILNR